MKKATSIFLVIGCILLYMMLIPGCSTSDPDYEPRTYEERQSDKFIHDLKKAADDMQPK